MFYDQNKSKILQNLFHALLKNPINKKTDPPQKKPKAVKDRGGVEGRYDRGQRFNVFFLKAYLKDYRVNRWFLLFLASFLYLGPHWDIFFNSQ